MAFQQRPFLPGERSSTRQKKPVDIAYLNAYGKADTAASNTSALMNSNGHSRKRKSTSSVQSSEPPKPAKRQRSIKTEPEERAQSAAHVGARTRTVEAAAVFRNGISKRKSKAQPRRPRFDVEEMTGSAATGLEAQSLTQDPDNHLGQMVSSDPTPRISTSTRSSISKRPKRRPATKSSASAVRSQTSYRQASPVSPQDVDGHVASPLGLDQKALVNVSATESIASKSLREQQLLTPESTQDYELPDEDERPQTLFSPPVDPAQTHYKAAFGNPGKASTTLWKPTTDASPGPQTPQQLTASNDERSDASSDGLSEPPDGLLDQDYPALPGNSDLSLGLSKAEHTSSAAAAVHEATVNSSTPFAVSEPSYELNGSGYAQAVATEPQEAFKPEPAQTPQQPRSELRETTRPRSRRSTRPVKRFGELMETNAAVVAATEHDGHESSSWQQDSTQLENDDYSVVVDDNDIELDGEDESIEIRSISSSDPSKVKRRKPLIPSRRRAPKAGLVTLKLPISPVSAEKGPPATSRRSSTMPSKVSALKKAAKGVKQAATTVSDVNHRRELPPMIDETGLNHGLLELSRNMSHREPLALKPEPIGKPEVWADSRQALCETVPYFRMPQSGCHQNDRHVYAFLFDATGHCREYMDSDVVIARAGGGMEGDGNGSMHQKKDHMMTESQVQSVLNDIEHQNPVVIIAGNRHEGAICKFPRRYNVLGWYKPVAVWAEKTLGKGMKTWTTIKYRFERLNPTTSPWFAPAQSLLTEDEYKSVGPLSFQTCGQCNIRYPVTYLNGWMCLSSGCDQFWKLPNGQDAPYGKLHYNPAFLLTRTRWPNEEEPFSVRPPVPAVGGTIGDNLTYINTRGICCPRCGRCSSRRLFKGWKCDNPACTYQNFPKHISVKAEMLHNPWDSVGDNIGDGPALAKNKHEKEQGVKVDVSHRLGFKIYTYTFDGVDGRFVHAVSNKAINRQPRGPDEMFAAMQNQDDPGLDMHLERRRFNGKFVAAADTSFAAAYRNIQESEQRRASDIETIRRESFVSQLQGNSATVAEADMSSDFTRQLLLAAEAQPENETSSDMAPATDEAAPEAVEDGDFMTAFSINYGMPYKFVATGASLPFTNAPWPVRACQADLNWASKNFLKAQGHQELNELLIFAYLQGQKIEYHDDGESGLGPRISTLSLGGKAKMHLRMKQKHFTGCSKSGILNAEKPIPGGLQFNERLAAWEKLQCLNLGSKGERAMYERRRREIPKEIGTFEKRTKKASDLVTITLNHGDIVLMEGYEIQQYLEHKVVPEGCLRFALTCRTVLPEHLRVEERPRYRVERHDPKISSLYRMDWEEQRRRAEAERVMATGIGD